MENTLDEIMSKSDTAKEKINDQKTQQRKLPTMETHRKKTVKKNQSISDLWDNLKWCWIHITIDT